MWTDYASVETLDGDGGYFVPEKFYWDLVDYLLRSEMLWGSRKLTKTVFGKPGMDCQE